MTPKIPEPHESADAASGDEVPLLYAPDLSLQRRIGVPLKAIFTDERIQQSQAAINANKQMMLERCFEDSNMLKDLCQQLVSSSADVPALLDDIAYITLRIKGVAGMVNYLIATQIAHSLYRLLQLLPEKPTLDGAAFTIVKTHINAINAAFRQHLTGEGTPVTQEVVQELQKMVATYSAK